MPKTEHCAVKITFSKTVPAAQAEQTGAMVAIKVGEAVIVNYLDQQDGNVKVDTTLMCRCFNDGNRAHGTCLAQSLRNAGLSFPQEAATGCIQNKEA